MSQGIGEIIAQLRKKAGYTQNQLSEGICSGSELARMECGKLLIGPFEIDRFLERMGKSAEYFEYVLSRELYELYEMRYLIQRETCHKRFKDAEKVLEKYERNKLADKPLHRQYILQQRGQIAWLKGEKKDALSYLQDAAAETIPMMKNIYGDTGVILEILKSGVVLCADELKLLLFWWEIYDELNHDGNVDVLKEILSYSERKIEDMNELVKVYPYASVLLVKYSKHDDEMLFFILKKSLELLRECGRVLFVSEVIEGYTELLEKNHIKPDEIKLLRRDSRILQDIQAEFDIHLEGYRLFQVWNREFQLDYEMVKKSVWH